MTEHPAAEGVTPATIHAHVAALWPAFENRTTCLEVSGRHALVERRILTDEIRPGGVVSGPAQFAAVDAAHWYAVMGAIGLEGSATVTSEMACRFVRPGVGERIVARAELVSVGSRSFVANVLVWTDDPGRPICTAQGTYVLPRGAPR